MFDFVESVSTLKLNKTDQNVGEHVFWLETARHVVLLCYVQHLNSTIFRVHVQQYPNRMTILIIGSSSKNVSFSSILAS